MNQLHKSMLRNYLNLSPIELSESLRKAVTADKISDLRQAFVDIFFRQEAKTLEQFDRKLRIRIAVSAFNRGTHEMECFLIHRTDEMKIASID